MGEDDDGRAGSEPAHVVLEPGELGRTEAGEAAGLEVHDVDQPDEVDALAVEAVPAIALRPLAMAGLVGSAPIQPVMLAGNVANLAVGALDDLFGGVELPGLGEMADIAGMDQESRLGRQLADPPERGRQGLVRMRIGILVEADMGIADLDEGEASHARRLGVAHQDRARHAPAHGPQHTGPGPGHAFQKPATVQSVRADDSVIALFRDLLRHVVLSGFGGGDAGPYPEAPAFL